MKYRKPTTDFKSYLEMHKTGVLLVKKYLESIGHRVFLNIDVVDTTVFDDPSLKFQYDNDFDLYDVTMDKRIDVKTTRSNEIWINPTRIRYFAKYRIYLWWLFWSTMDVIEVDPTTLDLNRGAGRIVYNRYGEKRLVFPKNIGRYIVNLQHLKGG